MAWTDIDFTGRALSSLAAAELAQIMQNLRETVRVYDANGSTIDVANTTSETSIYSKSIAAGDLETDRLLRVTIIGDYLHNNVAGDTITFKLKLGATTLTADSTNMGLTTGGRQPFNLVAYIGMGGATNAEWGQILLANSLAGEGSPATGVGDLETVSNGIIGNTTAGAEDTTASTTLDLTVQWSAGSANNSFRKRFALLELLQ